MKIAKVPLSLAGVTVGFGIAGKAFNSQGLTDAGTASGKFIAPAVSIGIGGILIKEIKSWKGGKK